MEAVVKRAFELPMKDEYSAFILRIASSSHG